jgi:hypothetical protein
MDALTKVLSYEVWILFGGLGAIIAYRLLTGGIRMEGLLYDKSSTRSDTTGKRAPSPGRFSPGRLQLLIVTIGGALYYLLLLMGSERRGEFPVVPKELLLALGGSHTFYLGGKLFPLLTRAFGSRRGDV